MPSFLLIIPGLGVAVSTFPSEEVDNLPNDVPLSDFIFTNMCEVLPTFGYRQLPADCEGHLLTYAHLPFVYYALSIPEWIADPADHITLRCCPDNLLLIDRPVGVLLWDADEHFEDIAANSGIVVGGIAMFSLVEHAHEAMWMLQHRLVSASITPPTCHLVDASQLPPGDTSFIAHWDELRAVSN